MSICELCGEPMPEGEQMFKFHGYSGPCPKPPLPKPITTEQLDRLQFGKELHERPPVANRAQLAYETFLAGFNPPSTLPKWNDAPSWVRDVAQVAYLQGKLDGGPAATPAPAELSFDQVLAAFDAITQEGKRQHVIVWGAMVSIQDIYNFIRVAHRAALAAPQAQEGHTCRPQYKMRELPDPDCKACTTVSRPPQAPIEKTEGSAS